MNVDVASGEETKLEDEKSIGQWMKDFIKNGKHCSVGPPQIKHDRVHFLSCQLTHCEWGEMCEMGQGISEETMNQAATMAWRAYSFYFLDGIIAGRKQKQENIFIILLTLEQCEYFLFKTSTKGNIPQRDEVNKY